MKKSVGEFEKRPRVKEATPLPIRRRRPIGWMLATCIFALLSLALMIYIIVDKVSNSQLVADKKDEVVKESEEVAVNLNDLMHELQTNIGSAVLRAEEVKLENNLSLVYVKLPSGVMMGGNNSLTVTIPNNTGVNNDIYEDIAKKQESFDAVVVDTLDRFGLKLDKTVVIKGYGNNFYYRNNNGIVCQYVSGASPISVDCADENTLPSDDKALAEQLVSAYKIGKGETPNSIVVATADIKDGADGRQSVRATVGDTKAFFYRQNSIANWMLFKVVTQEILPCSAYNSDDLLKAFANETCFNETTKQNKKVGA